MKKVWYLTVEHVITELHVYVKNEANHKEIIADLEQKVRTGQEEMEALKTEVDSKLSEYETQMSIYSLWLTLTSTELTRLSTSYAKNMRQRMLSLKQIKKNWQCRKIA